jgi:hypothetical protein
VPDEKISKVVERGSRQDFSDGKDCVLSPGIDRGQYHMKEIADAETDKRF